VNLRGGLGLGYSLIPLLSVLNVLAAESRGQPLSVKSLALTVGCSLPILTKHINHLKKAGFMRLDSQSADGRVRLVLPTEKLKALCIAIGLDINPP
jgi:DNA-binding IscR family transcriptional regulator